MTKETVASRWQGLLERICSAAKRASRDPHTIRCVAVSKGTGVSALYEAVRTGLAVFGENRVQEARDKFSEEVLQSLRRIRPDLSLHFIGSLQLNKVKKVVGFFDLIHSMDSLPLAEKVASEAARQGGIQPILVQVNLSGEKTKGGISIHETPGFVEHIRQFSSLRLDGLMTLPPPSATPAASRPYFAQLRVLGLSLGLRQFSMGMSNDFEVAIEEGATWVRIGRALFNEF